MNMYIRLRQDSGVERSMVDKMIVCNFGYDIFIS